MSFGIDTWDVRVFVPRSSDVGSSCLGPWENRNQIYGIIIFFLLFGASV